MSKKISSATLKKIIKAKEKKNKVVVFDIGDTKIEVDIKPYVTYQERCQMINDIVNYCYDEFGNYHPEFFDGVYKLVLIENFTNIDTDYEGSLNQMHILCENTDIISEIEEISEGSVEQIWLDAKDVIEWRNAQYLKSNIWDDVAISLSHLLDKIETKIDEIPQMNEEELSKLTGLASKLGGLSEEKIVDNILKFRSEENKEN